MSAPHDVHPHDLALLYDLVDGRLAPRAADELARRLAEEPELRSVHEGILALRRRLAALPTPPLPSDFLERVRAKAGFPAASPVAVSPVAGPLVGASRDTASSGSRHAGARADARPAADSDPAAGREPSPGSPSVARLLSFGRFAYAAAALIVVALGVFVYVADRDETVREAATQTADGAGYAARPRAEDGLREAARGGGAASDAKKPSAPLSAAEGASPAGGRRAFGPNGAIEPGLRTPADKDTPSDEASSNAPGAPEVPPAPALADRTRARADAVAEASEKRKAAEPDGTGRGTVGASGGGGGGGGGERVGRRGAVPSAKPGSASPSDSPASVPPEVFEGADRVLVVYADSYDAARAEVSLLVDDARSRRALDVARITGASKALGKKSEGVEKESLDAAKAREPVEPSRPGGDAPAPAAALPVPVTPLGTFFVELDDAAWARLSGALGPRSTIERSDVPTDSEAAGAREPADPAESEPAPSPPAGAAAPPAPSPSVAPAAPAVPSSPAPPPAPLPVPAPKPDADSTGAPPAGADEPGRSTGGEVRHVRIVVMPRR